MRFAPILTAAVILPGCCNPARTVSVGVTNSSSNEVRVVFAVVDQTSFIGPITIDPLAYALADPLSPGSSIHRNIKCKARDAIQCTAYRIARPDSPLISASARGDDRILHFTVQNAGEGQIAVIR